MNEFDHEMETSGAELGSEAKPKLATVTAIRANTPIGA